MERGEEQQSGVTRRGVLGGALALGAGVGLDRLVESGSSSSAKPARRIPFHGAHQAGIATPAQEALQFAAFDLTARSSHAVRSLLRRWSEASAAMTAGRPYGSGDPGEAVGIGPAALTITIGFGPGVFRPGRFGLEARLPPELQELPVFESDALDPGHSGGDLCVQACAQDPQVAFHAVHALAGLARTEGSARLRWTQTGFGRTAATSRSQQTLRALIGFKDGTDNIRAEDAAEMRRFVWVARGDGPDWMSGGSYLIARRIRILFDSWDALGVAGQEQVIGREKQSGAPLGAKREHDPVNLNARNAAGEALIPHTAHIRLASPLTNDGQKILRRGYSYTEPTAADERGQIEAGLFFISFQRSPQSQFVPLQTRLANFDALARHTQHTSSAIFACPPGAEPEGYVGQALFE
jgi:deferrochelatase/peroxidase EfeB